MPRFLNLYYARLERLNAEACPFHQRGSSQRLNSHKDVDLSEVRPLPQLQPDHESTYCPNGREARPPWAQQGAPHYPR